MNPSPVASPNHALQTPVEAVRGVTSPTVSSGEEAGWRAHHPSGLMSTLGPLLSRREGDGWAYALRIDARHLNQAGIVHGGTLGALMDQALSAIAWQAAEKTACVTVQLNMSFQSAVPPGALLIARGHITHRSGSMFFLQGTLHHEAATVATAQAVMKRV
jgi:uncharacterized protein (TIGR00369 family)